jgi:GH18 family chitinase
VMVAIGGWGDTSGFSAGAKTDESIEVFAQNVKAMLDQTGADGEFWLWIWEDRDGLLTEF